MSKILITIPMEKEDREEIEKIEGISKYEIIYTKASEVDQKLMEDCEIVLGNIPPKFLENNKNIRWVHLNSAGVNNYINILPADTLLSNSTGAYDLALAEHTLALVFALKKKLHLYLKNQESKLWRDEGEVGGIEGSKTLIVGLGNIGKEIGKKLSLLGSKVWGVKKNISNYPDFIEGIYSLDDLDNILGEFDTVISVLPETSETLKIFNLQKFKKMKKTALFINVGRGTTVVSDDLFTALEEEEISGAGIDVTHIEPLPQNNPLWDAKNLILTPHIAGDYHMKKTLENIKNLAIKNLDAYVNNKTITNLVDRKKGY